MAHVTLGRQGNKDMILNLANPAMPEIQVGSKSTTVPREL